MAVLKARDPNDPTVWYDVAGVGPQGEVGPTGPSGPVGPPSGGVNVVGHDYGGDQVTTVGTGLTEVASVTVHLKPESWYMLIASFRGIADLGAAGTAQVQIGINGVNLPTHSVIGTSADMGLFGEFSRTAVRQGKAFAAAEGDYVFKMMVLTSVAAKIIYSPEITLLEINDGTAPSGQNGKVETRTTRPGWHRIATFRGAGSAEFTVTQAGRDESAVRAFTLAWTGERMQLSTQGVVGYGDYLPNYSLKATNVYGEQWLDIETTATDAALSVEASWTVHPLESDPGAAFQPAGFTLSATEIAAPGGTATPWPAVAGGSAPSYALDDLTDVAINGRPGDNYVLTYDPLTDQWVPAAPAAGGGGGTEAFATNLTGPWNNDTSLIPATAKVTWTVTGGTYQVMWGAAASVTQPTETSIRLLIDAGEPGALAPDTALMAVDAAGSKRTFPTSVAMVDLTAGPHEFGLCAGNLIAPDTNDNGFVTLLRVG